MGIRRGYPIDAHTRQPTLKLLVRVPDLLEVKERTVRDYQAYAVERA